MDCSKSNFSPATPPYDYYYHHHNREQQSLTSTKRLFDSIEHHHQHSSVNIIGSIANQPPSPPDLLHDYEDDEEDDSLSTPSLTLSPKQSLSLTDHDLIIIDHDKHNTHIKSTTKLSMNKRRKSSPHRSPSIITDIIVDKSIVFQLDIQHVSTSSQIQQQNIINTTHAANQSSITNCGDSCDLKSSPKIICGQSLLSALRSRVARARNLNERGNTRITNHCLKRHVSIIHIPKRERSNRNTSSNSETSSQLSNNTDRSTSSVNITESQQEQVNYIHQQQKRKHDRSDDDGDYIEEDDHHSQAKQTKKSHSNSNSSSRRQYSNTTSFTTTTGRPNKVKGPCQACNEASDGCMRKAFNWPFPAGQIFYDKDKPYVYLCNKCGLRYNKSAGCVCRNCRWVFCKEEKRKALKYVEAMRRSRPDGYVDPDEDIENFLCSPKYWTCGRPWKVGWVLNTLQIEKKDETDHHSLA